MVRYFQTPDERLRGVNYLRQREEQRSLQLDQRLKAAFDAEKERSTGLDIREQMQTEIQRRDELDRFQEVERGQMAERRQRQDILDFREEQPPGLERLLSNVIRTGAQTAGLDLTGQELALPENLGGVTPPTVNLPPRQHEPGFLDKALGVAGKAGRVVDFITDPSQIIGRAGESLQRPSVTGPTLEQQRRQALFATTTERLAPPSLTEIQAEGATVSRPIVGPALEGAAAVVEEIEKPLGIEGVVSDKLRSQLAEDIATEVFNPINIALAAPFAMQGTAGLTGVRLAEQIAANLLFTGLEPGGVRGVMRGLSLLGRVSRLGPRAVAAALRTLPKVVRESDTIRLALKNIREAPEAGGARLGDVPPLRGGEEAVELAAKGPLETGIGKLTRALRLSSQRRTPLELQRTGQRIERVATERQMLDDLLAQGVPPQEAIPRARAAFKGEMAKAEGVLLDLTEAEQDAFWKVLTEHPLSFERQRGFEAVMKLMAEDPLQPNEVALLRRLYGDEFGDIAEAVGASKRQFLKELGEDFPRKIPTEKAPKPGDLDFAQLGDKPPRINPPLRRRILDEMLELLKVRQVFMTVMDVSFGFRQAAKLGARNPKEWVKGMKWGFRTIRSEADGLLLDAAQRADDRIVTMVTPDGIEEIPFGRIQTESADILRPVPGTPEAEAAGVLTREESAITNKLSRLWGIKQSQQSFVIALNKMRGDVLWKWIKMAETQGRPITPEFVRDMGNLLNRMTGRGELGQNWIAKALKQVGFAPGYRVSGPQTLMQLASRGKPHSGFIRRQAAENLAAWFGAGISLMGVAKVTGAADALGLDPFSSDFGKIRIGSVRYNIWGTDSVLARHVAQAVWEKRTDPLTGLSKVKWDDTLWRYIRSGADPNVGTVVDLGFGENFLGDPAGLDWKTLKREIESSFPLGLQDVKDIYNEDGWMHSLAGVPFAAGGVGISAYESDRQRLAAAYNKHVEAGDFGPDAPLYKDVGTTVERRDNINKFDDLKGLSGELESTAITLRNDRSEELLKLAEAVVRGTPGAMRNYHENRSSIMTRFAGMSENEFKDLNITVTGADNEILSQIYDVDFLEDRDGNGITGDDDDVRLAIEEQDKLKAQLSRAVQRALRNPENFFPDEDVVEVEKRRNAALDKVDFLFDNISKYQGATVEESEQTDEYARYVRQVQDNKLREFGDQWGWTLSELAIELGKEDGEEELGQWASWSLSGNIQRNDKYDQYLIANQAIIAPVFPFMYNRTVFRESGVLTDAIWQEVNVPIQSPTEVSP